MKVFEESTQIDLREPGNQQQVSLDVVYIIADFLQAKELGLFAQSSRDFLDIAQHVAKKKISVASTFPNLIIHKKSISLCDSQTSVLSRLFFSDNTITHRLNGVVAISGDESCNLMLKSDGAVHTYSSLKSEQVEGLPQDDTIASIYARSGAYYVLTTTGKLYSWGKNDYGQLGNGTTDDTSIPQLIEFTPDRRIIAVSVGSYHVLAIDNEGFIYGWGNNEYGQLGHDSEKTLFPAPKKITFFNEKKAMQIYAHDFHSFVCLCDKKVFAFGYNRYKQLGLDDEYAVQDECHKPQEIQALRNMSVVMLATGQSATFALTSQKKLLAWGSGVNNKVPTKLTALNGKAVKCCVAYYNSTCLALTDKNEIYLVENKSKRKIEGTTLRTELLHHNRALRELSLFNGLANDCLKKADNASAKCTIL